MQNDVPNIKFANNIHSSGGYSCGRPAPTRPARVPLPYPPYGTLNFFDQTAKHVLDGIKAHRGTAILPQQTGPVIDVLYSAAGNSADEAYYAHGIIGYDFEIGDHELLQGPGDRRPAELQRRSAAAVRRLDERLPRQRGLRTRRWSSPAATTALLDVRAGLRERHDAAGRPATGDAVANAHAGREVHVQRGVARSTTRLDGSTPTTASTEWKPNRARARCRCPSRSPPTTTLKWIAVDFKGNTSAVQSKTFLIETDQADDRRSTASPRARCSRRAARSR